MGDKTLRIYIDDSGQKEYGPATSRYFVYAGVMVPVDVETEVATRFSKLKTAFFGTSAVEIKSNWMRQPRERRNRYLEPYGVTNADFDRFVEHWYELMAADELTYLAAVVDKPSMIRKYANPWHPSATAYQFLLQRFELQLRARGSVGLLMIDDMSGSTPAHNQWRALLVNQHRLLKKHGCSITKLKFDHVADGFVFANSAHHDLLQVADIVAYNVYRQFRSHGDEWDKTDAANVPIYSWLGRILPRFAMGSRNEIEGWGIVKWPSERTSRWKVNFGETPET